MKCACFFRARQRRDAMHPCSSERLPLWDMLMVKKAHLTRSLPGHWYGVPRRRTILSEGAEVFALATPTLSEWQRAREEVSHGESRTCGHWIVGVGGGRSQWDG